MKRSELKSLIKEVLKEHSVSSYNAAEVVLKDIINSIHPIKGGKFEKRYGLYLIPQKNKLSMDKGTMDTGTIVTIPFTTPEPNGLEFPESFEVEIRVKALQTFISSPKKVP